MPGTETASGGLRLKSRLPGTQGTHHVLGVQHVHNHLVGCLRAAALQSRLLSVLIPRTKPLRSHVPCVPIRLVHAFEHIPFLQEDLSQETSDIKDLTGSCMAISGSSGHTRSNAVEQALGCVATKMGREGMIQGQVAVSFAARLFTLRKRKDVLICNTFSVLDSVTGLELNTCSGRYLGLGSPKRFLPAPPYAPTSFLCGSSTYAGLFVARYGHIFHSAGFAAARQGKLYVFLMV
jgi:hypothetical protein